MPPIYNPVPLWTGLFLMNYYQQKLKKGNKKMKERIIKILAAGVIALCVMFIFALLIGCGMSDKEVEQQQANCPEQLIAHTNVGIITGVTCPSKE